MQLQLQEAEDGLRMYAMDTQCGVRGGAMAWRPPRCEAFAENCRRAQVRPFSARDRQDRRPQDVLRSAVGCLLKRKPHPREIIYADNDETGLFQTMIVMRALGLTVVGPESTSRMDARSQAARTAVEALVRRGWARQL